MNRILIFSPSYFPHVGGAEVAVKEITDRLQDFEFLMITAKLRSGLAKHERIGRVEVHRVGFGFAADKFLLPLLGPLRALRLTKAEPAPLAWSLMATFGGFAGLVFTWFKPQTRWLLTLQEGYPMEYFVRRTRFIAPIYRAMYRRADRVQAISQYLAAWAKRLGFRGDVDIIPNGVDIEAFSRTMNVETRNEHRKSLGFASDDIIVVTTSRLTRKNGIGDLIDAIASLPERYKLLIIGAGEDEQALKLKTQKSKLKSRIAFLGAKPHRELPEWLQASDIFCRPSLSEGLGNSFLEAMAAGIPVVATPVGGIPDFLKDDETGLLCAVQDPPSCAAAIKRFGEDAALRERVTRQAKELVSREYAWDGIAKRFDALFRSMIS